MRTLPKIVAAAIRFRGKVYSLPPPNRHSDIIRWIAETYSWNPEEAKTVQASGDDQGFLDEDGRYLRRVPALTVARHNNQVLDESKVYAGRLFSENVW